MYSAGIVITQLGMHTIMATLQAVLLGIMTLRRLYRSYPAFYVYTVYETIRSIATYWVLYLLAIRKLSYATYFFGYWATEPIGAALIFWIVYQVFGQLCEGYTTLRRVAQTALLLTAAGLLLVAIVSAMSAHGNIDTPIMAAALLFQRSTAMMVCGLLVALFVASRYLQLAWRSQILGIALGFGLTSAVDMANTALRMMIGPKMNYLVSWAGPIGYTLAILTWLLYFVRSQQAPITAIVPLPDEATQWNSAVTELLSQ